MIQLKFLALIVFLTMGSVCFAESGLPWTSDFETGNTSEWNGFGSVGITDQNCQSGTYCAMNPLVAGTFNGDNYREHFFGDYSTVNLDKVDEVYLEFHSKIDPGYELTGRLEHKLAIINLTDETRQRRYQVYIAIFPGTLNYGIVHSYIDSWRFFGLDQNAVTTPVALRLGQWDKLKLYVKLNTPNVSDGIVQFWVNNQLVIDHSGLNLREATNYSMNKLILTSYTTGMNSSNGMQYWDNWRLYEPTADSVAPSPPVIDSIN
ncbi:MAG: hypothetical protein OEZ68_00470 [Gammaproteobacteria bacterium]|nr:hypothetical protein [Gammaproteobacteria bacterium]MDH5799253.1 hypothetical protein [Gammaproteobacteria bacterium]